MARGRPRKKGVARKSGRIVASAMEDDPSLLPKWNRGRDFFLAIGGAPRLITQRGKLFCLRMLNDLEFEAANRWADLLDAYGRIKFGMSYHPRPPSLEGGRGRSLLEPDEDHVKAVLERVQNAHDAALQAGREATNALTRLCRDEASEACVQDARAALAYLILHFGLKTRV